MRIILLAIVIIGGLAYFNVDLHSILDTPVIQNIFSILKGYGIVT